MPLFFLGTREWRNRQTRTVQVRVPVMEWGFNSPLAHDETADPLRICGFCFAWLWLCCYSWPHGCFGCPRSVWAGLLGVPVGGGPPASRPRRELRSARRLEARPGPAATHRHRSLALRSLRRPSHLWGRAAPWAAARPLAVRADSPAGSWSALASPGPATGSSCPSAGLRVSWRPGRAAGCRSGPTGARGDHAS